jgi:hypothetical protein
MSDDNGTILRIEYIPATKRYTATDLQRRCMGIGRSALEAMEEWHVLNAEMDAEDALRDAQDAGDVDRNGDPIPYPKYRSV